MVTCSSYAHVIDPTIVVDVNPLLVLNLWLTSVPKTSATNSGSKLAAHQAKVPQNGASSTNPYHREHNNYDRHWYTSDYLHAPGLTPQRTTIYLHARLRQS